MDEATNDVVLSLQLEDLDRLIGKSAPQGNDIDNIQDGRMALISYRDELAARLELLRDRILGSRIAQVVLQDEHAGFNGNDPQQPERENEEALLPSQNGLAPPASLAADEESLFGVQKTCVSCGEAVPYVSSVYTPCGHDYCKDCAKQIFVNATRDEALFPPRCCRQHIPLAAVDVFLTPEFVAHFEEKSVEFQTANRIYCAWPTCSAFISPSSIKGETAVCAECGFWVCIHCKGPTHQGRDCPQDPALNLLMETAREEGWQRCHNCRRFVELSLGCNHMICPCGGEFCYKCARRWKTCDCNMWDEQHLVDQANHVADARGAFEGPEPRDAILNQIQDDLRENPECDHAGWRRIARAGRCDGCQSFFRHFIYFCGDCGTHACAGCRQHRL